MIKRKSVGVNGEQFVMVKGDGKLEFNGKVSHVWYEAPGKPREYKELKNVK